MGLKLLAQVEKKIVVWFLIMALPFSIILYFALFDSVWQRREIEVEKGQMFVEFTERLIVSQLEQVKIALNNAALGIVWSEDGAIGNPDILRVIADKNRHIDILFVAGLDGRLIGSSQPVPQYTTISDREYFSLVLEGQPVVSPLLNNKISGEEMFVVAIPYFDYRGRVRGVLAAVTTKSLIRDCLSQVALYQGGNITVFDETGKVIYSNIIQRSYPQIESSIAPFKGKAAETKPLAGWGASSFDGEKRFVVSSSIKGTDWGMTVCQPPQAIWYPMAMTFFRNLLILVICLAAIYVAYQNLRLLKQKEMEEERLRLDKLMMVGELAAGVAHEIRNPLTAVKGFLQMIGPGKTLPTDYYGVMWGEINAMEKIINELLLLSKPADFKLVSTDLRELIGDVVAILKGPSLLNNIEIQVNLVGDLPLLMVDKGKLKQVFINVGKNAIEAMSPPGKLSITVSVLEEKWVEIQFRDTGPGIPEQVLEHVGTPFLTTKEGGTGLGLLVSSGIIQNHGGKFNVDNDPRGGAVVTVLLPVSKDRG